LHAAGLLGPSPFPTHTLEAIHEYSTGVPRLINLICDGCLSLGFRTQSATIQPDLVEEIAESLNLSCLELAESNLAVPVMIKGPAAPSAGAETRASEFAKSTPQAGERAGTPREATHTETEAILLGTIPAVPVVQKTAVDMLIEAMKQRRTSGRGASSNEQVF
jgi:hypothetical protein